MKKHKRIKRLEEEVEKLSSMIMAEVNASEDLEGRMGGEIMKAKKYAKDEARKYKEDLATNIFPRFDKIEKEIKEMRQSAFFRINSAEIRLGRLEK